MVAPIVGLAVGAAARAVAKKVASNAVKSAATKKLVKEAAKKKPLTNPKSAVRVKPAARQIGNPPDLTKVGNRMIESVARSGGGGRGPLGKTKDARVVNAKGLRKGTDASARGMAKEPARLPKSDTSRSPFSYKTIQINSAPRKTAAKPGTKRKSR